jgi:chromate transporter
MSSYKRVWQLFISFLKAGSFTFGGGLAMLPLIRKEVVDKRGWMKDDEMLDAFAIGQSMPGAIAVNVSVFVGRKVAGYAGAIAAAFGVVLPAFVSIIIVLLILTGLRDNPYVDKVFTGIKAASAALILLSVIKLGKSAITDKHGWVIAVASFIAVAVLNLHAVWVVLFAGLYGYFRYLYNRRKGNADIS